MLLFFFFSLVDVSGAADSSLTTTTVTIHAWPLDEATPVPMAVVKYKYETNDNNNNVGVGVDIPGAGTGTGKTNATLLSYTPPKVSSSASSSSFFSSSKKNKKNKKKDSNDLQDNESVARPLDLVRVGLYESGKSGASGRQWTGVVVGRSGLAGAISDDDDDDNDDDKEVRTTLVLHVDTDGVLYGVGIGAERVKKTGKKGKGKGEKDEKGEKAKPNVAVEVSRQTLGPRPHLNKPIPLSPDGRKKMGDGQEPEKTFLQK